MSKTGFSPGQEMSIQGLVCCFRADKPSPTAGLQLPLDLEI
jgi:hypothetical protein